MQNTVSDEGANNQPGNEDRQEDDDAAEYDEEEGEEEEEEEGALAEEDFQNIDRNGLRPVRSNTLDQRMTSRAHAKISEKQIKDEAKKPLPVQPKESPRSQSG